MIYTVLLSYHTIVMETKKLKCFTHTSIATTPDFLNVVIIITKY